MALRDMDNLTLSALILAGSAVLWLMVAGAEDGRSLSMFLLYVAAVLMLIRFVARTR